MKKISIYMGSLLLCVWSNILLAEDKLLPIIHVVAAENFYGNVAETLGNPYVDVTSVMNNPNQDPHTFNAHPQLAVDIDEADIIIENGLGYDTWMKTLYSLDNRAFEEVIIDVSRLLSMPKGYAQSNPHLWYNPTVMPRFAKEYVKILTDVDPIHQGRYEQNLATWMEKATAYQARIVALEKNYAGIAVTATEPIADYLLLALGFKIHNQAFQRAVMNDSDLTPAMVAQFEDSLNQKQVKLLIINAQVNNAITKQLVQLAKKNTIPIVSVTESMPAGLDYYTWMNQILDGIEKALLPA